MTELVRPLGAAAWGVARSDPHADRRDRDLQRSDQAQRPRFVAQLVAELRMGDADELITERSEWHSPAASRWMSTSPDPGGSSASVSITSGFDDA
jgi:hypothetical protein